MFRLMDDDIYSWLYLITSVVYPFHYYMDPDLDPGTVSWNNGSDSRSKSNLKSRKYQFFLLFCLIFIWFRLIFCGNFPWFWLIFCYLDPFPDPFHETDLDPADQNEMDPNRSRSKSTTLHLTKNLSIL